MDPIHYSFESFITCKDDKVEESEDLLEKSWFFGNLLDRKTRMSRCYSDPCPTSNYSEEMLVGKESYSSIRKALIPEGENLNPTGLIRTPSLSEDSTHQAKGSNHLRRGKSILKTPPRNNLLRTPSLPSLVRDEIQDEESDFSMSRLIRQASLKHSDVLPPRHVPKGVAQSSSTPRHRQRRKPDLESILKESSSAPEGIRRQQQHTISRTQLARSSSDLGFQELKGLGDLSIKYDKSELDQDEANTFPGLQEKNQIGKNEDCKLVRKPSSSEAWEAQRFSSPPIPDWAGKRSAEDMKAQIKFWARAVASNVR